MADTLWNIQESESKNFLPGNISDNSNVYTAILSEIRRKVALSFIVCRRNLHSFFHGEIVIYHILTFICLSHSTYSLTDVCWITPQTLE